LLKKEKASVSTYFEAIGGAVTQTRLAVPTNRGLVELGNGQSCNSKPGMVQIFVYKIVNGYDSQQTGYEYVQSKVDSDYLISPFSNVPPGDCIIIEFDNEKDKTDKICETYTIAINKGDMKERK